MLKENEDSFAHMTEQSKIGLPSCIAWKDLKSGHQALFLSMSQFPLFSISHGHKMATIALHNCSDSTPL